MGLKFMTVMYDAREVSDNILLQALRQIVIKKELELFGDKIKQDGGIVSMMGSKLVKITHEHPVHHFKMIEWGTIGGDEHLFIQEGEVAQSLSTMFPDIAFIVAGYHSGSSTGWLACYVNGELKEVTEGEEGDSFRGGANILGKYFGIKDVYETFEEYFIESDKCSPYSISGYPYLKHNYEELKNSEDSYGKFYVNQYKGVEKLIDNPNMDNEELVKHSQGYHKDFLMSYVENYRAIQENRSLCKLYSLTTGFMWEKELARFTDKPTYLSAEDYFKLKDKAREARESYKDMKYGKRPASYSLTKDELNTLSYDEQKKRAYELYEYANRRGDETYGNCTNGIAIQLPAKRGEYVRFKGEILRAEKGWFKGNSDIKSFIEVLKCIKAGKDCYKSVSIEPDEFHLIEKVAIETVPEDCIVPDKYLH